MFIMKEEELLAWNNSYIKLPHFEKALSSFCMNFCVNKDADGIMNGVQAYD